jgi:hypothetical protein
MGRGLSDLQRYILAEAGTRNRLYTPEILAGFFQWPPRYRMDRLPADQVSDWLPPDYCAKLGDLEDPSWQYFSKRRIGRLRYARTMAVLSRSIRRLESRGLVTHLRGAYAQWNCVQITDTGREWLSVNRLSECKRVNR